MNEQFVNKKQRITAHIRDSIIAKALETSGINQRAIDLINARAEFAEKVRQYALKQAGFTDASIIAAEAEMDAKYPAGCHARDFISISFGGVNANRFNVNINGMYIYLWLDGRPIGLTGDCYDDHTHLTELVKTEQKTDNPKRRFTPLSMPNINNPDFVNTISALDAEKKAIKEDKEKLEATLRATIKRFGTIETMLEAWPDVEELLPAELQPSKALAISPEDLNAICGIPTGK